MPSRKLLNVDLETHSAPHRHQSLTQSLQRLMPRATWPKPAIRN